MRKNIFILVMLIVATIIGSIFVYRQKSQITKSATKIQNTQSKGEVLDSVFAKGLDVPWSIAFLPNGDMLVTERSGSLRLVSKDGVLQNKPVAVISDVKQIGEGGLLGIVLDPEFPTNNFIYLYFTYAGTGGNTMNRVVRYEWEGGNVGKLQGRKVIVDEIPGASNHDGGRIKFGPDGFLYITTGDAQEPSLSQNTNSLAGKILRVTDEGIAAPGNPFGNRIYSYGHRNPQGITWDNDGVLWETEHGSSAFDEVNKIIAGQNYGWPEIRGDETQSGMTNPFIHSGEDTWAPAGLAYFDGSLYFAGLRGEALYKYNIQNKKLETFFKGEFGRLRDVVIGPDKMLYVTTSNRDGRGAPKEGDDKILKINPTKL